MDEDIGNKLANLILMKECELETSIISKKPTKVLFNKVESLLKLYTQAIEYYESIESELFVDMTLRMQQLLVKPDILSILSYNEEADDTSIGTHPPICNCWCCSSIKLILNSG